MEFSLWLAFVSVSIPLLLIPGPTILLVLSYALSQGRGVALATVAGVAVGDFLALSVSLAGLGALLQTASGLFILLKWIGAIYLIFLGIQLWRSAPARHFVRPLHAQAISAQKIFVHSALVTALNPKSILFFITFVPQFIVPESALFPQAVCLIPTFVALAALNALAYALLADRLRQQICHSLGFSLLTRLGGAILIAMGIAVAIIRRDFAR